MHFFFQLTMHHGYIFRSVNISDLFIFMNYYSIILVNNLTTALLQLDMQLVFNILLLQMIYTDIEIK